MPGITTRFPRAEVSSGSHSRTPSSGMRSRSPWTTSLGIFGSHMRARISVGKGNIHARFMRGPSRLIESNMPSLWASRVDFATRPRGGEPMDPWTSRTTAPPLNAVSARCNRRAFLKGATLSSPVSPPRYPYRPCARGLRRRPSSPTVRTTAHWCRRQTRIPTWSC